MEETGRDLLRILVTTAVEVREAAAEAAFAAVNPGAVRQRIHVLAPLDVVRDADEIFRGLRHARDYVATADPGDAPGLLACTNTTRSSWQARSAVTQWANSACHEQLER